MFAATALSSASVVPLLIRAQAECAFECVSLIFGWAVERYDEVAVHLDAWAGLGTAALPPPVRRAVLSLSSPGARSEGKGAIAHEAVLGEIAEQLRVAMLRVRHGL